MNNGAQAEALPIWALMIPELVFERLKGPVPNYFCKSNGICFALQCNVKTDTFHAHLFIDVTLSSTLFPESYETCLKAHLCAENGRHKHKHLPSSVFLYEEAL